MTCFYGRFSDNVLVTAVPIRSADNSVLYEVRFRGFDPSCGEVVMGVSRSGHETFSLEIPIDDYEITMVHVPSNSTDVHGINHLSLVRNNETVTLVLPW